MLHLRAIQRFSDPIFTLLDGGEHNSNMQNRTRDRPYRAIIKFHGVYEEINVADLRIRCYQSMVREDKVTVTLYRMDGCASLITEIFPGRPGSSDRRTTIAKPAENVAVELLAQSPKANSQTRRE